VKNSDGVIAHGLQRWDIEKQAIDVGDGNMQLAHPEGLRGEPGRHLRVGSPFRERRYKRRYGGGGKREENNEKTSALSA
jgi:hypothetical protein